MSTSFVKYTLASVTLIFGVGLSGADAFVAKPVVPETAIGSAVVLAAMCGYSCRSGGRYIPGPPSVCEERGLNFCGPSRRSFDEDRRPGGYGAFGRDDAGGSCRTITIERDDGTVRRIRRCD
jgi:hypothetical protein